MNKGFIIKYGPHFQCIKPIDIYVYLYLYWFRTSFSLCVRPWSPKAANYYCVKYCHSRINRISTSLMPSQLNKFLFSLKKGKHGSNKQQNTITLPVMANAAALCIEMVLLFLQEYSWCVWKSWRWERHFTATFPTTLMLTGMAEDGEAVPLSCKAKRCVCP